MNLKALCAFLAVGLFLIFLTPQVITHRARAPLPEADRAAITLVLTEQQTAWNRADVKTFMQGYWNSPELTFAGSSGITRG